MRSLTHYVLHGREIREERDVEAFGRFFADTARRTVAKTEVAPGLEVSTIFLGIDHNFSDDGPPILFETMVFGDYGDTGEQHRYRTWAEAEVGHMQVVDRIEAELALPQADAVIRGR